MSRWSGSFMRQTQPAKLIEIHCSERDRFQDMPLHEAIVQRCRQMRIAGVTVLRGLEGYGETTAIHRRHLLGADLPVTVIVVDSAPQVQALAEAVEQMLDTGMMAI